MIGKNERPYQLPNQINEESQREPLRARNQNEHKQKKEKEYSMMEIEEPAGN